MQEGKNPLLTFFKENFGTPPFSKIKTEHFEPAFRFALELKSQNIRKIAKNRMKPTFKNTIERLEDSGELLDQVSNVFFNLLNCKTTPELVRISEWIMPLLTKSTNDIYLDEQLFTRVKEIYKDRKKLELTAEQARLLEETYRAFKQNGAELDEKGKIRYQQLTTELDLLSLTFEQNVLKDEENFQLILTKKEEVAGLSPHVLAMAHKRAREQGEKGWLFDLSEPSYIPFMQESKQRNLREIMYRAHTRIGANGNEYDNRELVKKIANKRCELAKLLGYYNFAEYKLKYSMAKDEQQVFQMYRNLLKEYKPLAIKEYQELESFMKKKEGKNVCLMPWDWSFYSEQLKKERYGLTDEMTRPYFELSRVVRIFVRLMKVLFRMSFAVSVEIEKYHSDVQSYVVYVKDYFFLGTIYIDFYARKGKQSGAWVSELRAEKYNKRGKRQVPTIILATNFAPPTDDVPTLLTFDEVRTFMHEFGHALHTLFSDTMYASLSGTNVYSDFVEFPSQLMENWLREPEFLRYIAVHYKTDEPMPEEMMNNLIESVNFQVGYKCCRQIGFGLLDQAWHRLTEPYEGDVEKFERNACEETNLFPSLEGSLVSTSFTHIFSGGYAGSYYGYKWAEILEAEAFELFKRHDIFDRNLAESLVKEILSKGNTEEPDVLFFRFCKKWPPSIDALLRRNGLRM